MTLSVLFLLIAFLIITVASYQLSGFFIKIGLPAISGLLVVGILAGPYVLNMVPKEATTQLFFIGDISLAFIAFAAGSELRLKELRKRQHYIKWLALGQLMITFSLISVAVFMLSDVVPYLNGRPMAVRITLAMLTAGVLCARSPASVIAVINELRAKGSFTNTIMGATVLMDFIVIVLFAITFALTNTFIQGEDFSLLVILKLVIEIGVSIALGFVMSFLLKLVLSWHMAIQYKSFAVLLLGWSGFLLYYAISVLAKHYLGKMVHIEPLLICIIGSFILSNYTVYKQEFNAIIHRLSKYVYCVFFTYAGMLLAVDLIASVWELALVMVAINLGALIVGTFVSSRIANDEIKNSSLYWTAFLTQAGVGLGLATTVNKAYPGWGQEFTTIVISVIVINQLIGPPLFKWAIGRRKESHVKAPTPEFDGTRDAIIMGFETQSVALARQLKEHGWEVKMATRSKHVALDEYKDLNVIIIDELNLDALNKLDAKLSEAIVLMFTDDENLKMAELIYEHIGTKDVIVRLNHRYNFDKFHQLGALVVDPSTAIVSLLDHFVRSPQATSLLLGMQEGQDTIDLQVLNPNLFGITLRDLRMPNDVIILSIRRKGQMIISHGYTRLRKGDWVTMVGSNESLQKMTLLFDSSS